MGRNKALPVFSLMGAKIEKIEKIEDYEEKPESRFNLCRLCRALARIWVVL